MPRTGETCARPQDHPGGCAGSRYRKSASTLAQPQKYAALTEHRQGVLDWWKLTHGCESCGFGKHCDDWQLYRFQAVALDLDHTDPSLKLENVSRMCDPRRGYSEAEFIAEVHKCRVLCANCHRIKTVAAKENRRRVT